MKKKPTAKMADWAGKQADVIVSAFLDDDDPDDLLRLEEAIAKALRAAYASGASVRRQRPARSPN